MKRITSWLLCLTLAAVAPMAGLSQGRTDGDVNAKIRREEADHSQIMRTMHYLTDIYGPRLTGSPNHKAAAEWAVKQMTEWGFENAHLEPWDFGHPGWLNERLSAHIISPVKDELSCKALAWTPGTSGTVTGNAVQLVLPEKPTQAEMDAYLTTVKDKVKGKIVLAGKHQIVKVITEPTPRRMNEAQARERFDPNNPNAGRQGNRPGNREQEQPDPTKLTARQINEQVDQFLLANGALLRVNDSGLDHGQIRAFNNRTFDIAKVIPTVVMRNEDYGRISRILADSIPVELEFNIVNRTYPEGSTSYNTIGEIPGTDKKDEVIMLGGHLDSWHSATGATDNAIGCAVMMEAARILKAAGIKPRRTIRVALWSGEEQGLLGSQAYVKEHFGSVEEPKPEFFKLDAYLNIDAGTGRARGASVFGPAAAADVLREALKPFGDLGVMGAIASKGRNLGGSDNTSFSHAGLPGIGMGQDPIEYFQYTWHTSLDTYEHIIEDDVKISATVIAALVYQLAMRDEMLPRFDKADMPPPPKSPEPAAAPPSPTPRNVPLRFE
ncbi:MAG TPA: M20/M25/M40 family metallo-hydrolase [Blastocatellia bacterium]|nr:M20/M25/M40 family metallo-hydrolase [Blastocatellia bacterium]